MYAIEARNITKEFIDKKRRVKALDRVSLKVKKGEIYGLLGPNGAGKTTLVYILSTLLTPKSGNAKVLNLDTKKDAQKIRENINVCFGGSKFYWSLTPKEILNYYGMLYGMERDKRKQRIEELIDLLKFRHFAGHKFHTLSRGMKQKVAIAKSLINGPKVLFMDEPTVGLDVEIATDVRNTLKDIVKEKGMTVLLTSHYMHEIEIMCKNITLLNKGRVVREGNVNQIEKSMKFPEKIWFLLREYDKLGFLKKLKYVKGVELNENGLFLEVENAQDTISKLIKEFKKRRIKILDLEIRKATLEDAFLKLVGGKNV